MLQHGTHLALLVLVGHFTVSCLDTVFLHSKGSVDVVQLEVESTGVTHRLTAGVPSPQCGGAGVTVGTLCPSPLTDNQSFLWPDQGTVLAIHLVIKPTGVTQVVSCPISTP